MDKFEKFLDSSYGLIKEGVRIGKPKLKTIYPLDIKLPLGMLTRHGLIAGTTGTGKSRAAQLMAEQLSEAGVPVIFSDVKGDVSAFNTPGEPGKVKGRASQLGIRYSPKSYPTVYFSLSEKFIPLRTRLSEFGAILLAKLMELNSTQESHLNVCFIYASSKSLRIDTLEDLESLISFVKENDEAIPGINKTSLDVILRKTMELKAAGLGRMFGRETISPADLLGTIGGKGVINVFNLSDVRDNPQAFTTAMAFLLFKLFNGLEDTGDQEKPRAVVFFDEAHYLFKNSNKTLVNKMVTVLRQIRSKGVGVFFVTQDPEDIPEDILELLSCKIQFALRSFTRKDFEDIKYLSRGFPESDFYDLESEFKSLGVGEAIVSALGEGGKLLPPVKVVCYPPSSSMGMVDEKKAGAEARASALYRKYSKLQHRTKKWGLFR